MKDRKRRILLLLLAMCFALCACAPDSVSGDAPDSASGGASGGVADSASDSVSGGVADSASGGGQIAIPGYETLYLTAGQTRQGVSLYNPAENNCYFRISLITADGETLWTCGELEPGASVDSLELSRPLDAGTYPDAILKYECFAMGDGSPLNGAEIHVTLDVT